MLTLEDRGQAVAAMGEALARFLPTRDDVGGAFPRLIGVYHLVAAHRHASGSFRSPRLGDVDS